MIQQFLVLLYFQCFLFVEGSSNIQQQLQSTNANLPTFNSLWESNKHYIESKNAILSPGGDDKLKSNVSISDSASQELDGYVYFQFIDNLVSSGSPAAQSYLTLGASTEVCHLDEDGVISYKLSLVNAKDKKSKWNGNTHLILLKMFTDSQCSVEFGKYLLPSFDTTVEELEMYDNQLLITTSTFMEPQKLPIPVKGTLIKVAPKGNENLLNFTAPPYIFAIENNTPIFNNIGRINAKVRDDELSLRLECSIIDSENKLIKYTAMKHNQSITFSQKSTYSNIMIFLTSSPQKNVSTLFYHQKLHTSDLFVSEMQFVEDVPVENGATPYKAPTHADLVQAKSTEAAETSETTRNKTGNLRGAGLKKTTTTDDNDDNNDVYDDDYSDDSESNSVKYGDSVANSENVNAIVDTDVLAKVSVYEQLWVATIECI